MLATDKIKMVPGVLRSGKNPRKNLQGKMVHRMNWSNRVDVKKQKENIKYWKWIEKWIEKKNMSWRIMKDIKITAEERNPFS